MLALFFALGLHMGLPVFQSTGQLKALSVLTSHLALKVILFQNDRQPKVTDTLGLYTEANFSGYGGFQNVGTWNQAVFVNGRAKATAPALTWTQNGGPTDNLIYGVCVVDEVGNLFYVERDPRGPQLITPTNPIYSYTPVLADTSEYAG